MCFGARGVYNF